MLSVFVVGVGTWLAVRRDLDTTTTYWRARTENIVRTRSRMLNAWWEDRLTDARIIASSPEISRVDFNGGGPISFRARALVDYWLDVVMREHGYRGAWVVGRTGVVLASADSVGEIPSPEALAVAQEAVREGRVARRLLGASPSEGEIVIAAPVFPALGDAGTPVAAFMFVIDPEDQLFPLLTDDPIGTATAETILILREERDAILISPTRGRPADSAFIAVPIDRHDDPAVAALIAPPDYGEFVDYRGTAVYAATDFDSLSGWGLIRKVDRKEALAEYSRTARLRVLVAALFCLAIGLGVVTWARGQALREDREALRLEEAEFGRTRSELQARVADRRATRFARLLDDASDEIVVFDAESWTIQLANRTALEHLGYRQDELLRRTPLDVAPDLDLEAFRKALARLRAGESARVTFETEHQRRDGRRYPVELRIHYSRAEDPPAFVAIATDTTARRQLEDQLRQAQKMEAVGRLAGGIAHDFNNLLTVILGCTELALSDGSPETQRQSDLEQVHRASLRAAELTRQLLAFSRRQILQPAVWDLNALVKGVAPMFSRVLGEDIDLVLRLAPSPLLIKIDAGQLEQVITNLVVNARDAMPAGGRLTIDTSATVLDESYVREHPLVLPGRYAVLSVSDTGLGMAPDVRSQVFEPFFTTKEIGKGTGLGLATVYGIVRQSGGAIWVYSEPGHGSTFKIHLPLAAEEATVSEGTRTPVPMPGMPTGHETVLLVEDDAGVRQFAGKVLTRAGFEVLQAGNGEEAIRIARDHRGTIHLLLTDVVMPRIGGRALAERLSLARPDLRILYTSGFTEDAIVHHGILEQGLTFLPKPFNPNGLLQAVRAVLDQPARGP